MKVKVFDISIAAKQQNWGCRLLEFRYNDSSKMAGILLGKEKRVKQSHPLSTQIDSGWLSNCLIQTIDWNLDIVA